MTITVKTNNVPRDVIDGYELTPDERQQFDYYEWPETAHDDYRAGSRNGLEASFFRYKGELHDLGEFSTDYGITRGAGLPDHLSKWDGYRSDTFFSALVVRYVDNCERVVVGRVYS